MKYRKCLSIGFLLLSIAVFISSIYLNMSYFYTVSIRNIWLYQLKQAGAVLLLFAAGYLFLKAAQEYFDDRWISVLAFPCGICLWVFVSFGLLAADIVYYAYRVYLLIGLILAAAFLIRRKRRIPLRGGLFPGIGTCCIAVGTALLVSTGWNYVIMNYDSYLYFADYGKTLTVLQEWKAFSNENSYVLTNIGQFLPLLNSYTAFWGLDYCLPVQSFLMLNTAAVFAVALYDKVRGKLGRKKSYVYVGMFVLLLITCTALFVYSNWLLSNAYLMVYLFLALMLGDRAPGKMTPDYAIVLMGAGLAVTLLRKDGIIIICFVYVCYACRKVWDSKRLVFLFLPSASAQLYYIFFIKKVIHAQTHTALGTSILNTDFIIMTAAAAVMTVVYLLFIHDFILKLAKGRIYLFLLAGLILTAAAAFMLKPLTSIDHIDAVLRVLSGSSYGLSILVWGVFLCAYLACGPKLDYEIFIIAGYCLLTFLIYWNKGNTEHGIDNSGMRAFYQIIPMIYYAAGVKLAVLFGTDGDGKGGESRC